MGRVRIEFTVEPFVEGRPGPHVKAAIDAASRRGLEVDVGPFSTIVDVPGDVLHRAPQQERAAIFEQADGALLLLSGQVGQPPTQLVLHLLDQAAQGTMESSVRVRGSAREAQTADQLTVPVQGDVLLLQLTGADDDGAESGGHRFQRRQERAA